MPLSEFEALQALRRASEQPEHWRAAAWILERRYPEKYGKQPIQMMVSKPPVAISRENDNSGVVVNIA